MIPETTRGTFGAFRDPGPTCPQARCESHVIRAPFSAKERDSGSVYTYDTPPEKSRVTSRGQFSLTSTNVAIPTILSQRLQGLYGNHMQHLWETMTGQGTQGRGETNALPHPPLLHGYTTLPGPHQRPRPRIRTTHALKTQTTSPKTPQIRSISPKWSALWAHPSPTPPMWRQQQGLRGLPQCPWATEPGRTSETTHRTTRQQPAHRHGGRRRVRRARPRCRWAAAGPGHASRRRADPHQSPRPHRCGERRRARVAGPDGTWNTSEARLRCPWAAAGPGRASRRHAERSSQRGRLAGGPPPTGTGTPSSPAQQAGGPIHINHHDPTGVEGTGGTGGHGRASRRGTERSEVA